MKPELGGDWIHSLFAVYMKRDRFQTGPSSISLIAIGLNEIKNRGLHRGRGNDMFVMWLVFLIYLFVRLFQKREY